MQYKDFFLKIFGIVDYMEDESGVTGAEAFRFSPPQHEVASNGLPVDETKHAITQEEFRERITHPEEYRFGEQVTRTNFISMLVESFAKSRGHMEHSLCIFTG